MTKTQFVKEVFKSVLGLPDEHKPRDYIIWVLDVIIHILVVGVWIDIFGRWSVWCFLASMSTFYLMDVLPTHQDWVYNKLTKLASQIRSRYVRRN